MTKTVKYSGYTQENFKDAFIGWGDDRPGFIPDLKEGIPVLLEVTKYKNEDKPRSKTVWRNVIWSFDQKVGCDQIVYAAEYHNSKDQALHRDLILKYIGGILCT